MNDTILLILYVVILIYNQMTQMPNTMDMFQYKSRLSRYGDFHFKERMSWDRLIFTKGITYR